jgi:hypothetical protein
MPFAITNIEPRTDAKVSVKFAGLLLLRPNGSTCEVGVNRFTTTHEFQVTLVIQKPNRPPTLIRLTTGPLTAPFNISADPVPLAGFSVFEREPFDRSSSSHELDYRWALNLRDKHPDADYNEGAYPPVILNAGVLYTSTLTREGLEPQLNKPPEQDLLNRVAADLAVAIDLPCNGKVNLDWSELGAPQHLELPRENDPEGTIYTISLMNDPPLTSIVEHEELKLYYKVLQVPTATAGVAPIAENERWRLDVPDQSRTDEIPCLPIVFNP